MNQLYQMIKENKTNKRFFYSTLLLTGGLILFLFAAVLLFFLMILTRLNPAMHWSAVLFRSILFFFAAYLAIFCFRQLRQRVKEYTEANEFLDAYGVSLDEIQPDAPVNRFFLCMIRGILIFMASYGTIAGLVSAFDLPFARTGVTIGILLVSLLAAFLYYNKFTFYFGYFILFTAFTALAFSFYPYINSGFQAFTNTVYQKYGEFFFLSSIRESNELIDNRYLTISISMVFVGLMMALLLNIIISARMNLLETFLITFLPLQIALYIDRLPAIPYLAMLLAVYITVGILKRSSHYRMSLNMKQEPFFTKQKQKKRKKAMPHSYSYQSSSKGILTLALYSIFFCMIFLVLCNTFFFKDLHSKGISNQLKNTTDAYVKTYVQSGLWGFFDRYSAIGGLSNGKLGGVGSVNPDYQTDLTVTFVPYSTDTIYLKGYTGVHYSDNIFAPDYDLPQSDPLDPSLANGSFAKMEINFVDPSLANESFATLLYPYDTICTNNGVYSNMTESGEYTEAFRLWDDTYADYDPVQDVQASSDYEVLYMPYISRTYYEPNPAITPEYETMVYENYLDVPEYLEEILDDFCQEAGLTEAYEEAYAAFSMESFEEKQQLRLRLAGLLRSYFAKEFPYTMSPGATPRNRDTVEYFLTEQRRGFCAHFASSAALILRHMGIPTRYVEGYCIQYEDLMEAEAVSTDYSDWFIGENNLPDTGLLTVEVSDGSAHAWIEIYLDGYGWIPFEMTPPSFGDTINQSGLASLFSGLFTPVQRLPEATGDNITANGFELPSLSWVSSIDFIACPLLLLCTLLAIILILIFFRQPIRLQYCRFRALQQKDYSQAILLSYCSFVRKLKKAGKISQPHPLIRDIGSFLKNSLENPSDASALEEWVFLAEAAAFGQEKLSETQYRRFCRLTKEMHHQK